MFAGLTNIVRKIWRYYRSSQEQYNEEGQTIHWTIEKRQKEKHRSTKCTPTNVILTGKNISKTSKLQQEKAIDKMIQETFIINYHY